VDLYTHVVEVLQNAVSDRLATLLSGRKLLWKTRKGPDTTVRAFRFAYAL